ncbi:MAG: trp operon repressor [Candidatus Roizmanbacteria bacterium]|nr:trp operon repressor [Candidatus Roizmanbacteria bacterium]
MARISKKPVDQKLLTKIYKLFYEVFLRYKGQEDFLLIMDDIFSPTEKIMLAKRLAIIYLLIKKVDYRDIADTLKVSTATILYYATTFYKRNSQVVNIINKMLKNEKVLNFLDDFFANFMIHPGVYIGHWKLYRDHQRKQESRKVLG